MVKIVEVAREFYRRVGSGDIDGVIELLSENVKWSIPGPPAIPYAGIFHGRAGVLEFFRILFEHEDLRSFEPREFIVDETTGCACVLGSETAVAINTGITFTTEWAEIFRFEGGLISEFEEHIDTYTLAKAYSVVSS